MPEICENWFGLVNSCVYFAHQTREIYQVLPYLVDTKAPIIGSFEIHWVGQHLVNVVLFWIKDLPSEMTLNFKSNLYVGPVIIFRIFDTVGVIYMI